MHRTLQRGQHTVDDLAETDCLDGLVLAADPRERQEIGDEAVHLIDRVGDSPQIVLAALTHRALEILHEQAEHDGGVTSPMMPWS